MNRRIILALLFLIPVIWGAISMTAALTASEVVICPGENVGEDGEERPGPMRPGDENCSVLMGNQTVADRTYEMQQNTQRIDRKRNAVHGGLLIAYGALGLACFLTVPSAGRAAKAH